mgnify:FL=1
MRRLPVFPSMQCDDGCGACCGPVPVTKGELYAIKLYLKRHGIVPNPSPPGLQCSLFDGQRCTVHPVRPLLCQAYGHSERLECYRGYNTNIPDVLVAQAVRDNGPAVGMLTELLRDER